MAVLAVLATTLGTIYQTRSCSPFDLRWAQVVQFAASAKVTLPFAIASESLRMDWTPEAVGALLWSVVVITGGGMTLLLAMLRRAGAIRVTTFWCLVLGTTAFFRISGTRRGPRAGGPPRDGRLGDRCARGDPQPRPGPNGALMEFAVSQLARVKRLRGARS